MMRLFNRMTNVSPELIAKTMPKLENYLVEHLKKDALFSKALYFLYQNKIKYDRSQLANHLLNDIKKYLAEDVNPLYVNLEKLSAENILENYFNNRKINIDEVLVIVKIEERNEKLRQAVTEVQTAFRKHYLEYKELREYVTVIFQNSNMSNRDIVNFIYDSLEQFVLEEINTKQNIEKTPEEFLDQFLFTLQKRI